MPPAALPNRLNAIFISCIRISCAIDVLDRAQRRLAHRVPAVGELGERVDRALEALDLDRLHALVDVVGVCGRWSM
jgi:hypothetical protein